MAPYASLYAPPTTASTTTNGGSATAQATQASSATPASSSAQPQPAITATMSATKGETTLPGGGMLGPPVYAAGDVIAGELFSPENVRAVDCDEATSSDLHMNSSYPVPSQGHYELPAGYGFSDQPSVAPAASHATAPPRPSPLHIRHLQPSAGLVEYPVGSKNFYIMECLACHKAFNSAAEALIHIQTAPIHVEVKDLVGEEEAVMICGCRVVDATDQDFARMDRGRKSKSK